MNEALSLQPLFNMCFFENRKGRDQGWTSKHNKKTKTKHVKLDK